MILGDTLESITDSKNMQTRLFSSHSPQKNVKLAMKSSNNVVHSNHHTKTIRSPEKPSEIARYRSRSAEPHCHGDKRGNAIIYRFPHPLLALPNLQMTNHRDNTHPTWSPTIANEHSFHPRYLIDSQLQSKNQSLNSNIWDS